MRENPRLAAQVAKYGDAHASRSITRIRQQLDQERAQAEALREREATYAKAREGDLDAIERVAKETVDQDYETRIRQDERQQALDGLLLQAAQTIGQQAHQDLRGLPLFKGVPDATWQGALQEPSLAGYVNQLVSKVLEGYVPKSDVEAQIKAARQDERVKLRGEAPAPDLSGSTGMPQRGNGVDWSKPGRTLLEEALRGSVRT